jgi:hypothetical protein
MPHGSSSLGSRVFLSLIKRAWVLPSPFLYPLLPHPSPFLYPSHSTWCHTNCGPGHSASPFVSFRFLGQECRPSLCLCRLESAPKHRPCQGAGGGGRRRSGARISTNTHPFSNSVYNNISLWTLLRRQGKVVVSAKAGYGLHEGPYELCGYLWYYGVSVGTQSSHSGGNPISQRENAGFSRPGSSVSADEPGDVVPKTNPFAIRTKVIWASPLTARMIVFKLLRS